MALAVMVKYPPTHHRHCVEPDWHEWGGAIFEPNQPDLDRNISLITNSPSDLVVKFAFNESTPNTQAKQGVQSVHIRTNQRRSGSRCRRHRQGHAVLPQRHRIQRGTVASCGPAATTGRLYGSRVQDVVGSVPDVPGAVEGSDARTHRALPRNGSWQRVPHP